MNTPTPLQHFCHSSLPVNPKLKYKIGKEKLKTERAQLYLSEPLALSGQNT